jgi:hypothetical protein
MGEYVRICEGAENQDGRQVRTSKRLAKDQLLRRNRFLGGCCFRDGQLQRTEVWRIRGSAGHWLDTVKLAT